MKEQIVFPQPFAVIRRDEYECAVENAATLQVCEEFTQLLVEKTNAAVIAVSSQVDVRRGQSELIDRIPVNDDLDVDIGFRRAPEAVRGARRHHVYGMGVKVVEEGEKRTRRLAAMRQPGQEFAVNYAALSILESEANIGQTVDSL